MSDSTGFIDLDQVVSPDIRVELGGREYRLPGDPPTETLLRVSLLADEIQKLMAAKTPDAEKLLAMREELSEEMNSLFAMRLANHDEDGKPPTVELTDVQIGALLDGLFAHYFRADAKEGDAADPPTSPASTRPRRKSSQRSAPRSRGRSAASASSPS